jgi:hypothetical protein
MTIGWYETAESAAAAVLAAEGAFPRVTVVGDWTSAAAVWSDVAAALSLQAPVSEGAPDSILTMTRYVVGTAIWGEIVVTDGLAVYTQEFTTPPAAGAVVLVTSIVFSYETEGGGRE